MGNKPLPREAANCRVHLAAEVAALPHLRPVFSHSAVAQLAPAGTNGPGGLTLVGGFHPSRQNTHTGRATPAMYDDVFSLASRLEIMLSAKYTDLRILETWPRSWAHEADERGRGG